MPDTTNEPTTSNDALDLRTPPTRQDRAAQLLDAAMSKVAKQIQSGPVSSSLLREIVQLAKAAGVEIAESGQPMSAAADSVLASLADVDPALFVVPDDDNDFH